MDEQFCDYEISIMFKELGFNEPCLGYYMSSFNPIINEFSKPRLIIEQEMNWSIDEWKNSNFYKNACSAPLYQQVIDWFANKYKIWISIDTAMINFYEGETLLPVKFKYSIEDLIDRDADYLFHSGDMNLYYDTYQEARKQSILKAIEVCKNK